MGGIIHPQLVDVWLGIFSSLVLSAKSFTKWWSNSSPVSSSLETPNSPKILQHPHHIYNCTCRYYYIYIGVDCPFVFKRVAGEIHMFVGDIMLYLYLNAYSELQFQGPECKPWRLGPHWQRQDFNLQLVSENRICSGPKVASYHFGALVVDIPSDSGKHTKSYWKWP